MFDNLTMKQLREEARKYGIKPYSRGFRVKAGIVAALKAAAPLKEKLPAQDIREEWVKGVGDDYHYCCQFASLDKDKIVDNRRVAPCHAALAYMARAPFLVLDVSNHYRYIKEHFKNHYIRWVEYWLNESPMARVFETKTWAEAEKYGILIDGTKWGVSEIAVACIGLREGSEFEDRRLPLFRELLENNIPSKLAWLVACNFDKDYRYSRWSGAHQVMNSYGFDPDAFFNWLNTGELLDKGEIFSKRPSRYQVSYAISKPKEEPHDLNNFFISLFNPVKSDDWVASWKAMTKEKFYYGVGKLSHFVK